MGTKNIYYARDYISREDREKKITEYSFGREGESLNLLVQTKGKLFSIDSVSQEQYLKWRISVGKEDYFRQKDYDKIQKELSSFGQFIRAQFIRSKASLDAENCTERLESKGFRKLKDFEESALLNTLYGRTLLK